MSRQGHQFIDRKNLEGIHVGGEGATSRVQRDQFIQGPLLRPRIEHIRGGQLHHAREPRMGQHLLDGDVHFLLIHRLGQPPFVLVDDALSGIQQWHLDGVLVLDCTNDRG